MKFSCSVQKNLFIRVKEKIEVKNCDFRLKTMMEDGMTNKAMGTSKNTTCKANK